ncbi:hypothetical protein GCM10023238_29630 [Streptomyces heliomycini]
MDRWSGDDAADTRALPGDRAPGHPGRRSGRPGPAAGQLRSDRAVGADEAFPLGTLRADGRVDLCKQGLGCGRRRPADARRGRSPHARHVLLGTNAIGDEGASTVARALADGHGLHTLYLGCNRIGPEGAAALAGALSTDDTVRALWLKRNPVATTAPRPSPRCSAATPRCAPSTWSTPVSPPGVCARCSTPSPAARTRWNASSSAGTA